MIGLTLLCIYLYGAGIIMTAILVNEWTKKWTLDDYAIVIFWPFTVGLGIMTYPFRNRFRKRKD